MSKHSNTHPTDSPAFKTWFNGSKVVDQEGNPLRVYHGTSADFDTFKKNKDKWTSSGSQDLGFWFATTTEASNQFAKDRDLEDYWTGSRTIPVYLSIKNPFIVSRGWNGLMRALGTFGKPYNFLEDMAASKALQNKLKAEGYDGIEVRRSATDGGGLRTDWIAFSPTQIKSAIGNNGKFSPKNKRITGSDKHAYLSPSTGTLDISVIRDSRPYVSILLDLGIPNFTVFSLKLPLVEDSPTDMSGIIAEAVHCILDEMSAFMISTGFKEEVIVEIYATVLAAFKGMSGESDTNKSVDAIGKDPVVKTFAGSFKLPMSFITETYDKIVTASSGKTIKRPPVTRHLELTYEKPSKTTVNDARKVIRDFKNRRLKSQPGPMYIIVYDTFGNPRATIPVGTGFKNQLLKHVYKKGSSLPQYTPTVKFDNDIEMKTTNVEGIPKSVLVGDEKYTPFAYIKDDMGLYSSEQGEWVVKFPDGRCVAFADLPSVEELKGDNYPVPTIYTNWTVLPKDENPESSDESEAVDSQGNEVVSETETESNPISDLKADDEKNEQLEEGDDSSKTARLKTALNVPSLVKDFGQKLVDRYKREHGGQPVTPEQVIDKIKQSDPTGNKEYTAWMVGQYARGNDPKFPDKGVKRFEDFQSRIAPALKRYDFLKRTGKLPVEERNIGQLHGALALETLVDKYKNEAEVSNRQQDVNKDKELTASGQAEVVLNDAKYKIIIPRTEEAAKWFGVNTKWCTAAETNNRFANYADDPLYIILIKADNLRFQFSFPHAQFMDERDSEINVYSWCKDYPELALFFEPIAEEAKDISWCSYCKGGKVDCSYCSGRNGEANCSDCEGEGTLEVEDDEGNKESEECSNCGGTGREDCSYCAGEGDVNCDMCAGTGESADIKDFLAGARRAKSNLAQAKAMGATASKMTRIQKLMKNRPDLVAKGFFDNPVVVSNEVVKAFTQSASLLLKVADRKDEKGYWVGEGGGASGILPICSTTGRICLAWRSASVSQGDCWGTIGGAIQKDMSASESAKMELAEETGYKGSLRLIPAFKFQDGEFSYQNYIGIVPIEFGLNPMEGGGHGVEFHEETDFLEWVTWDDLQEELKHSSGSFHSGLVKLIQESGSEIEKICAAASNSNTGE